MEVYLLEKIFSFASDHYLWFGRNSKQNLKANRIADQCLSLCIFFKLIFLGYIYNRMLVDIQRFFSEQV